MTGDQDTHLLNLMETLQGASDKTTTHVALSALEGEPHGLHLDKIIQTIRQICTRKLDDLLLGVRHTIRTKQVLGALGVDKPILFIQPAGLFQGLRRLNVITSMLQNASFGHIELHQGGGMFDSTLNVAECLIRLVLKVEMLSQKVECPQESRGWFDRSYERWEEKTLGGGESTNNSPWA